MTLQSTIERRDRRWLAMTELAVIVAGLFYVFAGGLSEMVAEWARPEFSYSYLVPPVAALIAARQWAQTDNALLKASWAGVAIFGIGVALGFVGQISTTYSLIQYALLVCVAGLGIACVGWSAAWKLTPAWIYLGFMVPVPTYFLVGLTAQFQLLSTRVGEALLRAVSVPVVVQGNMIDLGSYQLQVANACSGLRYLFPLMSFGFLVAYFYRGPMWKRVVLFLSTIPITIAMNGLRIGAIGVSVDQWGIGAAKGFTHLFEGWVVFLLCLIVLLFEALALARFATSKGTSNEAFDFRMPKFSQLSWAGTRSIGAPANLIICATLIALACAVTAFAHQPKPPQLMRTPLDLFPVRLGRWTGTFGSLDRATLDQLKLDDYLNAQYARKGIRPSVNLFVAYYASQKAGAAIHSPHNCLPAGGWQVVSRRLIDLGRYGPHGQMLRANRVLISKGLDRMLVYYWFQERGRTIPNAYLSKWFTFVDSLKEHRTDGALIRLATRVVKSPSSADSRLTAIAKLVEPRLPSYVPN